MLSKNHSQIKGKVNPLKDITVSSSHTASTLFGLLLGGSVSAFGIYSIAIPFFQNNGNMSESSNAIVFAMIGFIIILITIDSIKRWALARYTNSLIKNIVFGGGARTGFKNVAIVAVLFVFIVDALGSWATASKGASMYSKSSVVDSLEYEELQSNKDMIKASSENYTFMVQTWRESKADAMNTCSEKWNGWKAKYKATCKEDWNNANPMPTQTQSSQSSIETVISKNTNFLDESLPYFLFLVLLALTILMQYVTIIAIHSQFEDIVDSLTKSEINNIREMEEDRVRILEEHKRKMNDISKASEEERNRLAQDYALSTEKLEHASEQARVNKRTETANNRLNGVSDAPKKSAFLALSDEMDERATESKSKTSIKELCALLLDDVEVGEPLNSRKLVRQNGEVISNDKFSSAYKFLKEKGVIQDVTKGKKYTRLK